MVALLPSTFSGVARKKGRKKAGGKRVDSQMKNERC